MEPSSTLVKVAIEPKRRKYESIEDAEVKSFFELIHSTHEKITFLSFSGNSYSKLFCEQLATVLPKLVNLETLDLSDAFVGRSKDEIPSSLEVIANSLIGLSKLHSVDFSNNAVSVAGAQAISNFLENSPNLRVFHISNSGIGIEGSKILASALKKGKVSLEILSISRSRLENLGAKALAEHLKECATIREVHFFQNSIRKEGMIALLDALKDKKLETLDISDNFINEEAVEKFCEFLETNTTIKNINVSDCNIDAKSAKRIVEAFEKSPAVFEKLGFNRNELFDAEYAKRFVDTLLQKNPNLVRLDIKGNEFKSSTCQYYKQKFENLSGLSAFESGSEDEEEDLSKSFGKLKL